MNSEWAAELSNRLRDVADDLDRGDVDGGSFSTDDQTFSITVHYAESRMALLARRATAETRGA